MVKGTTRNCPNEPPEVIRPKAKVRFSGATTRAAAPNITDMLTADSARPISSPKLSVMLVGPWLCEASSSDSAYSAAPASATRQ